MNNGQIVKNLDASGEDVYLKNSRTDTSSGHAIYVETKEYGIFEYVKAQSLDLESVNSHAIDVNEQSSRVSLQISADKISVKAGNNAVIHGSYSEGNLNIDSFSSFVIDETNGYGIVIQDDGKNPHKTGNVVSVIGNEGSSIKVKVGERDNSETTITIPRKKAAIANNATGTELNLKAATIELSSLSSVHGTVATGIDQSNPEGAGTININADDLLVIKNGGNRTSDFLEEVSGGTAVSDGRGNSNGKINLNTETDGSTQITGNLIAQGGAITVKFGGTESELNGKIAASGDENRAGTITADFSGTGAKAVNSALLAAGGKIVATLSGEGSSFEGNLRAARGGAVTLTASGASASVIGDIIAGENARTVTGDQYIGAGDNSDNLYTRDDYEVAASSGIVTASFTGKSSSFTGSVNTLNDSATALTFENGSVWNVTADSLVTDLIAKNSTLDLTYAEDYRKVTAGGFTAGNTTAEKAEIKLRHNIGTGETDQLAVTGAAVGMVSPSITVTGTAGDDQLKSISWLISQGEQSDLQISGSNINSVKTQNGGVATWKLAFFKDSSESTEDISGLVSDKEGTDSGYWYLVRDSYTPDTPDDPVTPEVKSLLSGAVSLGQAAAWADEIEDLRVRLGEVRDDGKTGAWVRVKGYRERFKTANGFKQHVHGVHVGADSRIGSSGWFAGAAFRYADADQDSMVEGTEGDTNLYSLKGYATKLWENGAYFDAVVQVGHYDQSVTGYANDLQNKYSADYNGWGFGLSAEVGRKFRFGENTDAWYRNTFIEPQAQLSYQQIRGKDFTTSTGMQVSQDNAKFVTGRLGVVAGKEFRHDDGRLFQVNALAGIKRYFKGDQTVSFLGTDGASARVKAADIAGTRVYYGVSFNWVPKKNIRAYGEFRREQGDSYVKDYEVNLGLRYMF